MTDFDTPFRRSELVGYFRWDEELTESLSPNLSWLLHACHERQFRLIHRRNELFLRSRFEVRGGRDECDSYECVWASIQPWHRTHGHNHFGPITVKMPLSELDGRRFYVFKRDLRGWRHYYLVQRETTKALFGARFAAQSISPAGFFLKLKTRGKRGEKANTQYEIVLTEGVKLRDSKFIATAHNWCATKHCTGGTKKTALTSLKVEVQEEIEKLARRFPQFKRTILAASD
jgi:hypothetical protein